MWRIIQNQTELIVSGSRGGLWSNCTILLKSILDYVKKNKKPPSSLCCSGLLTLYKLTENENLFAECFKQNKLQLTDFNHELTFKQKIQYGLYKNLNFSILTEYVNAYFEPTELIQNIITELEKEHSIDYGNTCAVYYRGTDKRNETKIASYDEYFQKAREILEENPNIRFLVQTDEAMFRREFQKHFTNCFTFEQLGSSSKPHIGYHKRLQKEHRRSHVFYFLSAVIIMSKAEHVILPSSNGGLWIALYRNNANRVHQYLVNTWC